MPKATVTPAAQAASHTFNGAGRPVVVGDSGGQVVGVKRVSNRHGEASSSEGGGRAQLTPRRLIGTL